MRGDNKRPLIDRTFGVVVPEGKTVWGMQNPRLRLPPDVVSIEHFGDASTSEKQTPAVSSGSDIRPTYPSLGVLLEEGFGIGLEAESAF